MSNSTGRGPGRPERGAELVPISSMRQRRLLDITDKLGRPVSCTELAQCTEETLGATAHHVRALARAGYLTWAGERRARGALQTFYVLSDDGRAALRISTAALMRELFGVIRTPGDGGLVLPRFDEGAIDELSAVVDELRARYDDIAERSLLRLAQSEAT